MARSARASSKNKVQRGKEASVVYDLTKARESIEQVRRVLLDAVVEQFPYATGRVADTFTKAAKKKNVDSRTPDGCRRLGEAVLRALAPPDLGLDVEDLQPTPDVGGETRLAQEEEALTRHIEGVFEREALRRSLTNADKRWMLERIVLTRAVDNRMKQMFLSSELSYGGRGFQGKGFRSLGQEAISAGALWLRRGDAFATEDGWKGDVVAPLIRDLGMTLAFTDDVTCALNAQAGKSGPPLNGKDLHLGAPGQGVLAAAAPLTIATTTVTGNALAMKLRQEDRVAVSFIGEGGSSLGEWHESINLAAVRQLPMIFVLENNQTALSTRVDEQSRTRVFAEKARGYGIDAITIDGTSPEDIAIAFGWAAERARAGHGPTLIEVVAMRLCGHAHHDDMLYLGKDPPLGFDLPTTAPKNGYVDKERYERWVNKDPLARYSERLIEQGVVTAEDVEAMKEQAICRCNASMKELIARPWPDADTVTKDLYGHAPNSGNFDAAPHHDVERDRAHRTDAVPPLGQIRPVAIESAPAFDPKGSTYLDAIGRAVAEILEKNPEAFVIGEDVGPPYGNAFLLLREACERFGDRVLNAPIAEGAIIGAAVGAALEGMRPIAEMQFNDFVASGFNQVVNNAAKLRYRTGKGAPFVLRMPWGGLRRAGPYHSQDTSPWFYRSFGVRIVAPSTPHEARALLHTAAASDDPVLFYEHIGLYREPSLKQRLDDTPAPLSLGKAAFRKLGDDLTIISYGAFVHRALKAAERLERDEGVVCDVIDLRSLSPIDWDALSTSVERTGRVLLVGEDSRTGSILESIAARLSEAHFEILDGPVRTLGALDTPVPYAPSLEDAFLVSEDDIVQTARHMLAW